MTPDPHGFSGQVTGLLAMSPWRRVAIAEALFMAKAVRETGEPSEAVAMGRARALAMGADIADPVTDEEILVLRGTSVPVTEEGGCLKSISEDDKVLKSNNVCGGAKE